MKRFKIADQIRAVDQIAAESVDTASKRLPNITHIELDTYRAGIMEGCRSMLAYVKLHGYVEGERE